MPFVFITAAVLSYHNFSLFSASLFSAALFSAALFSAALFSVALFSAALFSAALFSTASAHFIVVSHVIFGRLHSSWLFFISKAFDPFALFKVFIVCTDSVSFFVEVMNICCRKSLYTGLNEGLNFGLNKRKLLKALRDFVDEALDKGSEAENTRNLIDWIHFFGPGDFPTIASNGSCRSFSRSIMIGSIQII